MEIKLDIRDKFLKKIRSTIIGPLDKDELLNVSPKTKYLYGYISPAPKSDDDVPISDTISDATKLTPSAIKKNSKNNYDDSDEYETPLQLTYEPSSLGISFQIRSSKKLKVTTKFARYFEKQDEEDEKNKLWKRKAFEYLNSISFEDKRIFLEEGIYLHVHSNFRKIENLYLYTITLVNDLVIRKSEDYVDKTPYILFQPEIIVETENPDSFCERPLNLNSGDYETRMYEFLYSNSRPLCSGHGVSAQWNKEKTKIWTEYIPSYAINPIDKSSKKYFGKIKKTNLNAEILGTCSTEVLVENLNEFIDIYQAWIEDVVLEKLDELPPSSREFAVSNSEICKDVIKRIKSSIAAFGFNKEFRNSFQLANLAIAEQSGWNAGSEIFSWRPFQLAFILLVLESFIDENRPSKKVADLLWFPTGGGKTEAYLCIISFLLFKSSFKPKEISDPGTQVFIRYTLRLLTTQQFERATALVMASEAIRKTSNLCNKNSKPFSIGLWIGKFSSPNSRKDAFNLLESEEIQSGDARQILFCPCCKSNLVWNLQKDKPVAPSCINEKCKLYGDLNIYTVDEDIYNLRPSIILGTTDKFIQILKLAQTNNLFFSTTGRNPELILQDELHLISGPLGSIAGLFEAAIDMICSKNNPIKIIGSTATIKNAGKQVLSLFDRDLMQFPPQGICFDDSCFAVEDKNESGRLYIGVSTMGNSPQLALAGIVASVFHHAQAIYKEVEEEGELKKQAETYTTLVSYFNSLKELGGANVLYRDQVIEKLKSLAKDLDEEINSIENICELTSQRSQQQINGFLESLKLTRGEEGAYDACLSTNMISVGVDVSRLGLMLINGQTKSKSEYIQASSRVGRKYPGIVISVFNASKVRDKSCYENFTDIHQNLYKDVEVTSLTPFSPECIKKALPSVLVTACRHLSEIALQSPDLSKFQETFDYVSSFLLKRCKRISPEHLRFLENKIKDFEADWLEREPKHYFRNIKNQGKSLLIDAEIVASSTKNFEEATCISNVRNVEAEAYIREVGNQRMRRRG